MIHSCFSLNFSNCVLHRLPPDSFYFLRENESYGHCDYKIIWYPTKCFQIPYLFSTKTCVAETIPYIISNKIYLAFNLNVNLCDSQPTSPTFLVLFKEDARHRNPAIFLGFTFIVFSQIQCVSDLHVSANLDVSNLYLIKCASLF